LARHRTSSLGPVLLGALVLLSLLAAGCGADSSKPAPLRPPRGNLVSIIEDEALLQADPTAALATFRRLGAQVVRFFVPWNSLAPNSLALRPPSGFDGGNPASYPPSAWTLDDEIVRDAHAAGLELDLTMGAPVPRWAEGPGAPPAAFVDWEPSAPLFGQFVHALGVRYSGHYTPSGASSPLPRINFWSIWNEPNYGPYISPQAIDHSTVEVAPRLYRGLVDAAWSALRATGHGSDTILIGETAPRGLVGGPFPGDFSGMVPLRFIRALYCVNGTYQPLRGAAALARGCPATAAGSTRFRSANPALFDATGFADHPYPQGSMPPNVRVTGIPGSSQYADLASLPQLERTLDQVFSAYGDRRHLPIWNTEFGYHTDPPERYEPSPTRAAAYLNWSEYISWRDPRVRSYDQYLLRDATGDRFATGLELSDGHRLATYYAYRMPLFLPTTTQRPGGHLLVWGCVRPVRYTHGPQFAQLQFISGALDRSQTLRTVRIPDRAGYFELYLRFPTSGRLRIAWRYPNGSTIFSRTVHVTAL
jgi:hypothetical protein